MNLTCLLPKRRRGRREREARRPAILAAFCGAVVMLSLFVRGMRRGRVSGTPRSEAGALCHSRRRPPQPRCAGTRRNSTTRLMRGSCSGWGRVRLPREGCFQGHQGLRALRWAGAFAKPQMVANNILAGSKCSNRNTLCGILSDVHARVPIVCVVQHVGDLAECAVVTISFACMTD